jgi:mRNA-degrading endonuclease RelE of RelBE toxin-antitoxin system
VAAEAPVRWMVSGDVDIAEATPGGFYSARRGPYRIIADVEDVANRIEILRIDHRSDVYRNG